MSVLFRPCLSLSVSALDSQASTGLHAYIPQTHTTSQVGYMTSWIWFGLVQTFYGSELLKIMTTVITMKCYHCATGLIKAKLYGSGVHTPMHEGHAPLTSHPK